MTPPPSDLEVDIHHSYLEHANSYITKPVHLDQFKTAVLQATEYWFSAVKLPPK